MTIDEAIMHAEEVAERCAVTDGDLKCEMDHRQLAEWLKELKRLREERKGGKWILKLNGCGEIYGECSICHMRNYAGDMKFCPSCGSPMNGSERK